MSKEVDKHTCQYCDSSYRLIFDLHNTQGHPKFCPFCSEETYGQDDDLVLEDDEE